ncbi:Amidohydrolase [Pigmentiphaga humi]|uniref:Amidohydrolase n=1 Tax=Pigmentiphaga humi TaxID=2478468 RepID=A0A3P4B813_9BURK|nr:amidohydrolase family protein [Pigmentiphaga humi]VCU71666.1 Amidohydrolase [Pigmentiphaga humi]
MATYDGPILDAFTHFLPPEYMEQVIRRSTNRDLAKRLTAIPMLSDLERRLAMMERWPRYAQVLTLSQPSADSVCGPDESPALARLGNDGLAAVVAQHRDRFPAFVASLPLNNLPAAVEEFDRAVRQCGAAGVQIDTNVQGVPLDDPRFFPLFEKAVELDVPVWLHPYRGSRPADYPGEAKSKYEIWQVLGWPYETSVAMARLVFSGVLKRLPTLKIITHHLGAMIPFFEGRIGSLWDQLGTRSADEDLSHVKEMLGRRPVEYFRMFYGDTAIGSSPAAIRCGLEFFGEDQVVFASDCPFDPEGGIGFIRDGIAAINQLDLPPATQQKIFYGNTARLLKLGQAAALQETNHA